MSKVDKLLQRVQPPKRDLITYTDTSGEQRSYDILSFVIEMCGGTDWNELGLPVGGTDEVKRQLEQYAVKYKIAYVALQCMNGGDDLCNESG